jgi:hypothetical protein
MQENIERDSVFMLFFKTFYRVLNQQSAIIRGYVSVRLIVECTEHQVDSFGL